MRTLIPLCIAALVLAAPSITVAAEPAAPAPASQWVWLRDAVKEPRGRETALVGKVVELKAAPRIATITITADNRYDLYVNGVRAGGDGDWATLERYDVASLLKAGRNVLLVVAENSDADTAPGPAGVAAQVVIDDLRIVTDASWRCSAERPWNLAAIDPNHASWKPAVVMGPLGATAPWGAVKAAAATAAVAAPPPGEDLSKPFELIDGDTVVFLGGEFVEQDIRHNHLEAALTARWPDRRIKFRNLGWSGDLPNGIARGYFGGADEGYRRLMDEIDRLKPTVVFIEYGSVASLGGKTDVDAFIKSLDRLVGDLRKYTARIVLLSPPRLGSSGFRRSVELGKAHLSIEASRTNITKAIDGYAKQRVLRFIDLYTQMGRIARDMPGPISSDGIRFNDLGYAVIADDIANLLGVGERRDEMHELRSLLAAKNDLYFHRYRPQNETYIRGFRKHEQGQNAKDIPAFDPLIEQAEARIAAFVQGKPLPPEPPAVPGPVRPEVKLDPEDERKTIKVAEGLAINLFAAEPMVANPIHMNFDARGRLWVATSPIYPQILPGAKPSDRIVVLEDTDGDGRADKSTVFADDLLIPTAVLPDDRGGAYVANSTELIHLADTNGDGKADQRRVVLAGFGTEDTHHILHTFHWGPDGALYVAQSIYIHTHAETPWGVERLMGSGIWRIDTRTQRARVVSRGMVNPWGHRFDRWGQSFATDGAGGEGINYAFDGSAFPTAVGYNRVLHGMNGGSPKYCGLEIVSGRHFGDAWDGLLVTSDFRGNRIVRFKLEPQGSGYTSRHQGDVATSTDRAFRPVDLKMGPDGAMYVADWFNPIINHGEVDFRDPRRDIAHGRIWRITKTDGAKVERPNVVDATPDQLAAMLASPEQYTRNAARRQLALRKPDETKAAIDRWVASLDKADAAYEQRRVEALWAYQTIGVMDEAMLRAVLASADYRARAAAVRVLGDRHEAISDVGERLAKAITDGNAQVRLEAVHAARALGTVDAVAIAARALDAEMDSNLDFALWVTMRERRDVWLPAFQSGKLDFGGDAKKVAFAVKAVEDPAALAPLVALLKDGKLDDAGRRSAMTLIGAMGQPADLAAVFDRAMGNPAERNAALPALVAAAGRGARPTGDLARVTQVLDHPSGAHLAGLWRVQSAHPTLAKLAAAGDTDDGLRWGAMVGLAAFEDRAALSAMASGDRPAGHKRMAIVALAGFDPGAAAGPATALLADASAEAEAAAVFAAFTSRKDGPAALAAALVGKSVPASIAAIGLRGAPAGNKQTEALRIVLEKSVAAATMPQQLSPEQVAALIKDVEATGDAARGEAVYRRPALVCMTCHAIAGGGGKVGPDLVSLGASAPLDYIVESLLEPSKKIKEGYHTVGVTTTTGDVIAGTLVREGGGSLVVRDATGKEVEIASSKVQQKTIVPVSLMPPGLTATLTRGEFVDLVAFMAALGKEGAHKAPANRFVRKWAVSDAPAYSRVDGTLAAEDVRGKAVRFAIDVSAAGRIGLNLNDTDALRLTRVGDEANILAKQIVIELPKGRHEFAIDVRAGRGAPLSVEVVDVDGSTGRATPVNE